MGNEVANTKDMGRVVDPRIKPITPLLGVSRRDRLYNEVINDQTNF
jgi:hypothetical protein